MKRGGLFRLSKRLQAFTMVEVLTAMVLSTIVIAMAYELMLSAERSFEKERKNQEKSNATLQFQRIFKRDIDQADILQWSNDTLYCSSEGKPLTGYCFDKDSIVRISEEGAEVYRSGYKLIQIGYLWEDGNAVKTIDIMFQPDSAICIPYAIAKEYTGQVLFRLDKIRTNKTGK